MFAKNFNNKIEKSLSEELGSTILISNVKEVSGGSINNAYCLTTNNGKFFIKTNQANRYPKMFNKEAKGLELLRQTKTIFVPKVYFSGNHDNTSFLLMEYIDGSTPIRGFWNEFGKQLAALHQNTNPTFGLDHNNYIGSLDQRNNAHETWTDFFINERLHPQIKLAKDNSQIDSSIVSRVENLYQKLDEIFPKEQSALLHGDLWSGNFMAGNLGEPLIMDPAVYYGHREMDIAMTKLFGGFNDELYAAYNECYPLEKDWEQRIDICNLYPLIVHVNLFGGSYLGQVKSILSKF